MSRRRILGIIAGLIVLASLILTVAAVAGAQQPAQPVFRVYTSATPGENGIYNVTRVWDTQTNVVCYVVNTTSNGAQVQCFQR